MGKKTDYLRDRLTSGRIVRVVGAHNGLGARLVERHGFDGVWASGLEISTAYGLPDANILTMTENLEVARTINEATSLPVVCDCDTGYGNAFNVRHMVRKYEAADLAAIVIEDKQFPKVNSFIPGRQELVSIEEFTGKIRAAKEAQKDPAFMVFARVEALIAGFGLDDALRRAHAYAEAGADGIVIHSKASNPEEVLAFARHWQREIPLVAIPTTYYRVTAPELEKGGFSMVIYANHGLRAAIRAVETTLQSIAQTGSTAEAEEKIASMKEVFDLQGMKDMKEDEKRFLQREKTLAVIPAARDHRFQPDLQLLLKDKPLCMVEIQGKTLLQRQIDLIHSVGITDICVIGGHRYESIQAEGAKLIYNPQYLTCNCAQSIMMVKDHPQENLLILYSDILFDRKILERLLESPHPITLVTDRAYASLPHREKALDLVEIEEKTPAPGQRKLNLDVFQRIRRIGKQLHPTGQACEFIGISFLRKEGVQLLKAAWEEALTSFSDRPFYEAPHAGKADFTDLISYLLDQGAPVLGMAIDHGWSEMHSLDDYRRIQAYFEGLSVTV